MAEETYEHDGKLYRKVGRKAEAGDYVLVFGHITEIANGIFKVSSSLGGGEHINYYVGNVEYGTPYGDGTMYSTLIPALEESRDIETLSEEISSLRQDLRTFAEQSTETAHELATLGVEVAIMDENIDLLGEKVTGIVEGMYADTRKDFTPAERLQYAISSGASAEEVRSFYDGFTIAIVEYSDGLDSLAPGKMTELRELVAVYTSYRASKTIEGDGE